MDENKNFFTRFNETNLMVNRKLHRTKAKFYREAGKPKHSHAERDKNVSGEKAFI